MKTTNDHKGEYYEARLLSVCRHFPFSAISGNRYACADFRALPRYVVPPLPPQPRIQAKRILSGSFCDRLAEKLLSVLWYIS